MSAKSLTIARALELLNVQRRHLVVAAVLLAPTQRATSCIESCVAPLLALVIFGYYYIHILDAQR